MTRFKCKVKTNNPFVIVIGKMVLILCHKRINSQNVKLHKIGTTLKLHLIGSSKTLPCLVHMDNYRELILHVHIHFRAEIFYPNGDVM